MQVLEVLKKYLQEGYRVISLERLNGAKEEELKELEEQGVIRIIELETGSKYVIIENIKV